MAGNTGNLTSEAIAARGPRMRLLGVKRGRDLLGFVIAKEGQEPFRNIGYSPCLLTRLTVYANSYSLGYLIRTGVGQKHLESS